MLGFSDGLVEYDDRRALLETYTELDGLHPPLQRLGRSADALVIETAGGRLRFDHASGSFNALAADATIDWSAAAPLPDELIATVAAGYRGEGVSYERLLLDLHSGRLFGRIGSLVVDGAALCLLVLALTGAYMWFKFKRSPPRLPPPI